MSSAWSCTRGTLNYVFITGYDLNSSNISVKTADAAGIFLDGNMQKITVDVKATNDNIEGLHRSLLQGDLDEQRQR